MSFTCAQCGEPAGALALREDPPELERTSFTGLLRQPLSEQSAAELRPILADAAALFARDPELIPAYCPRCDACYCGAHWTRWDVFDDDGWHDSIRGRCPHGHERMLED